eukprot:TRINITY_DN4968_c0_g2_i1.p1 TRINITY_DN4968_c0_g2~~TRINITY_DN4968_c0_g2_i1.p1  ORF type:complete len:585 (+),score=184.95 TRINITY_DN4968_c0_g2_i1:164-1756(+)
MDPVKEGWEMDHLCYRCDTEQSYRTTLKKLIPELGRGVCLATIGGREIATIEMTPPLEHAGMCVRCVEVPMPKPGKVHKAGLEHAEFVVGGGDADDWSGVRRLREFQAEQEAKGAPRDGLQWEHSDKDLNADVGLRFKTETFGEVRVKFHCRSLYTVAEHELDHGLATPFTHAEPQLNRVDQALSMPDGVHCLILHAQGSGPRPSGVDDSPERGRSEYTLYGGDLDGNIAAWLIREDGTCPHPEPRFFKRGTEPAHTSALNGFCVGSDDTLYSCSDDRLIRLWDPASGENTATLRGHASGVNAILLHNTMLFSCDDDGRVRAWDTSAGHQLLLQFIATETAANSLAASPGGIWVSADDGVSLWSVTDRAAAEAAAGTPLTGKHALQGCVCDGIVATASGSVVVAVNQPSAPGHLVQLTETCMQSAEEDESAAPAAAAAAAADSVQVVAFGGADDHVRWPASSGGLVYCGSDEGALFCWPLESGAAAGGQVEHMHRLPCGADVPAMAVAVGFGLVFCGDDDGKIAAFRVSR